MSERRSLGDILIELGKLTPEDADRALVHQREHGGYFGEALVSLGILTRGEIEWGLASQYDLPYVFPDPEAIDPAAAELVSPDWALAHLALPMMRAGDELTVVVDSPLRIEAAEGVARRVGCELRLALAAPDRIRDAIRAVYGRGSAGDQAEEGLPCGLEEALARIQAAGADRFGISVRGSRAGAWWDAGGTLHRRPLDARWGTVLAERLEPGLPPGGATEAVEARLSLGGAPVPVEVRTLEGEGGREILFRRREDPEAPARRFTPPPGDLVTEVALLARSGAARLLVTGDPPEAAVEILPHLPTFLFPEGLRCAHLSGEPDRGGTGLGIRLPSDPGERAAVIEDLRPFQLDIVTVALGGLDVPSLRMAMDAASVCFVLGEGPQDVEAAVQAGVPWELHLARKEGGHLEWTLRTLER